jgi:trans-2,3-dihydro-3-hydroxyanthranilate isomerase
MQLHVLKVNSFTKEKRGGNPAGVVLHPGSLNETQMKKISQLLDVSETAFLFPSSLADYLVRFFSPITEVDLCGHATIATFTVLGKELNTKTNNPIQLTQQTKAGLLPVRIYFSKNGDVDYVLMKQNQPTIETVSYDICSLADILRIPSHHICSDLAQQRVSTGLFTLPVCVSSYEALKTIKPDFQLVKRFCQKYQVGSLHVFTFETVDEPSLYHARNFAPLYGIDEDPVTGTANGAVSSYLFHHGITSSEQVICEQGDIIKRPGRVKVSFMQDGVWVGGKACIAESIELKV